MEDITFNYTKKGRTMAAKKNKLTRKQKCFVKQFLLDLNATQAAGRAGYKDPEYGRQLLTFSNVSDAIAKAQEERSKRTELTQDWVVLNLKSVIERCMQAEPIYDKQGNPTGQYRFDSAGANRALELLGKHLGMFEERHRVINDTTHRIAPEDAKLLREIGQEFLKRKYGLVDSGRVKREPVLKSVSGTRMTKI